MTGDYFMVPLHPDYFSSMALTSLAKTLPRWKAWAKTAYGIDVLKTADYPFPEPKATFIGAVIQKYRPRSGKASKAFQHWIDQLVAGLKDELIPSLEKAELLNSAKYKSKIGIDPWIPIMEVADFNSLIALSQEHQIPVYALTPKLSERARSGSRPKRAWLFLKRLSGLVLKGFWRSQNEWQCFPKPILTRSGCAAICSRHFMVTL